MIKRFIKQALSCTLVASVVLGLTACGSTKNETGDREHVTIKWVTRMNEDMPGSEEVTEAINEYLKEKLNTTLDITYIASSEYNEQISTIISSGSDWDFATAGTVLFSSNASRNAFLPLNDYIDTYLTNAKEVLPESSWDAYKINGKVYAVPPDKDLAENWGVIANQSLLDETGVTFPAEDYYTCFDLVDWYYDVKEARDKKYPDKSKIPVTAIPNYMNSWFYFDALVGSWNNTLVCTNIDGLPGFSEVKDSDTVFCPYYTEDIRTWAKTMSKMIQDGVASGSKEFDTDRVYNQQGILSGGPTVGMVDVDPDMYAPYYKCKLYKANGAILTTSGVQVGGLVVNANCENPERVLEVIDLLYSDEYLATTIRFGVEGKDWTDEDKNGVIELGARNSDSANRYWYNWYGWWFGSITTSKYAPGTSERFGELMVELNNGATGSKNMGFSVDTTPITNEIAACNNVVAEYMDQIRYLTGTEDVDRLCDDFEAKLKANGMDKIIKEVQKQLDNWKAAK